MTLFLPYLLPLFFAFAEQESETTTYKAPRQYVFAERDSEEFSNRTSSAPFTDITPNPLVIANSSFENLFFANTSIQAKSQGSPSISLRGSSQASRVLFVLNDIPLNFADGFGGSSLFIPLELTQNIQVIEGPTSALYGANAMAGAIHFKSKQFTRPQMRLGLGDADKKLDTPITTANASLVMPLADNKILASVFLENDRGDFRHTTDGTPSTRNNNSQNMRRFTLGSQHKWNKWNLKTFSLYSGLNRITPGPLHTPLVTSQTSDAFFAAVSANYTGNSHSSRSVLSASRFRSQYIDFGLNHSNSDKVFASEIFVKKITPTLLTQTTLDWNWNRYQSSYTGAETFDRTEPEIAQTLIYEVSPNFVIEPTLRYLGRYQQLLGQIHLPYRMDNARAWLSFGQGFRPPSLTDLYAQTSYFVGNSSLKPEESFQGEAGIGWDLPFVSVTSSLYKTRYSELFSSTSVAPGVVSKINIGKAETTGINMGAQIHPNTNWDLRLNHSLMVARELPSNNNLPFSPKNQSFLALTYKKNNWQMTAQHSLWSSFLDTNFNTGQVVRISSWEGTDLLLAYAAKKDLTLGLGVFNIFDNPRQLSFDFPEPQRRLFLSLELQL
ncbi:MAG: TonB-dependent receptor [Bdellovibrionaceae bacterium]|nr:TonB-dependent receptor [Pseudobdellovibrionaceae bacterium]